jgi:cysteine-S-conjugate beta-lyase
MKFDQSIDRNIYPSMKWNKASWQEHFGSDDLLPFWVADMDFPAPKVVIDSLLARVEHGIFGYEYKKEAYYEALFGWYADRHGWEINPNNLEPCPSVLNAIAILINQHSKQGDGVIVQTPVFFEFRMVIRSNGRRIIKNPLKLVDGQYQMDIADLESKCADPKNKILILCNPHNPVGRVWTRNELSRIGEICLKHNVLIISDEIHGDIIYPPHRYTPFISISDETSQTSVTCISPAKTFNIAGMVDALVIIPNETHRDQFRDFAHRYQINKTNVFASAAIEAAYSKQGGQWLDDLLAYLQANINFLRSYLIEEIPKIKLIEPEGTYLVWLDFRDLDLGAKELANFLVHRSRIAVNPGYWFGREGAGFARMNIACPRSILEEALLRLQNSVGKLK